MDAWCPHPLWNLSSVIWFPFPILFFCLVLLFSIINHHNLNHHLYADDNYLTAPYRKTSTLLKTASDCYLDIKNWMTQNKLQLNSEKREVMLIRTRQKLSSISVNTLQLDDTTVPLSDCQKPRCSPQQHTVHGELHQTAKSYYCQLHRISSVQKYLSTEATVKLVISLILSRLDHCNSLLSASSVTYRTVLLILYWKNVNLTT